MVRGDCHEWFRVMANASPSPGGSASLSAWGRHLEDELAGVASIVMTAVSVGSAEDPTAWVQGREAPLRLFRTSDEANAFIDATWDPARVCFVREVPALRFDTVHGSVTVTDVWGDTRYSVLRGARAQAALRIDTPLLQVARLVGSMQARRRTGELPVIVVEPIGWAETTLLPARTRLGAWSSYASWAGEIGESEVERSWAGEPNPLRAGVAVSIAGVFALANDRVALDRARASVVRAQRSVAAVDGVDVARGIADLERYLSDQG